DALAVLQRLCANEIDVAVGRMVYTPMLNQRGGFESDLTVTRLAPDRFLVVTGSAQATRDADWIARHTRAGETALVTDVSAMTSVLGLMGPNAGALLARVGAPTTAAVLDAARLPHGHSREIDLGFARVRAARMSYVGGPGYELYVPIESARHAYLTLREASDGLGPGGGRLAHAGYFALDALRIEAGRRAWGAELGPDETPFDTGMAFAVKLDKPGGFIGQEALRRLRDEPARKRIVTLVFASPADYAWGGEAVRLDGEAAGEVTSVGWSLRAGACVGLASLRGTAARRPHQGTVVEVDLWGRAVAAAAWDAWPPR
ncbi:MAG: aminomethyltransferase family protein, partial [Caldimonas sp.]